MNIRTRRSRSGSAMETSPVQDASARRSMDNDLRPVNPSDGRGNPSRCRPWLKAKARSIETPFNFVTTNDTHAAKPGSPPCQRHGEVVGILFDGIWKGCRIVTCSRIAGAVGGMWQPRIVESLRSVYGAKGLIRIGL